MKSVARIFVLSVTTLALSVACVEEKKKSEAKQQKPGTAAPSNKVGNETNKVVAEANAAARAKTATPEELKNIEGTWQVATIDGDTVEVNPLTAGKELGVTDSKPVIQMKIEKERIKIQHIDGGIAFFRADLPMKISGKLIEATDTKLTALPGLEFSMASKDKLTIKAYGRLSKPAARIRKGAPVTTANAEQSDAQNEAKEIRPHTYELTRIADAETLSTPDSSVKMEYLLKAPNTNITTNFVGKAAPTAEQTGRLSCTLAKAGESQGLRIDFYQRENESAQAIVPGHGLRLMGLVKFDLTKESEEVSMAVKAETGKETLIGQVEKSDKRLNLLLKDSNSCAVRINRKNRMITFSVKCSGLMIGEEGKAAEAASQLTEAEKKANEIQDAEQDEEEAKAEAAGTAVKETDLSETEAPKTTNTLPSDVLGANGSCHLQYGRPL